MAYGDEFTLEKAKPAFVVFGILAGIGFAELILLLLTTAFIVTIGGAAFGAIWGGGFFIICLIADMTAWFHYSNYC